MPRLSVVIPTYERTRLLISRAIPSVLAQKTDLDIEILVVGDGESEETGITLQAIGWPNVRYENRPRQQYPEDENVRWGLIGIEARNWGYDQAQGDYIMGLDDDDAIVPGAVETLYRALLDAAADLAYGRSTAFYEDRVIAHYGGHPPMHYAYCEGAWLSKHDLGYRFDVAAPLERGLPCDGDKIDRMVEGGVKFVFVNEVVHHYWPNRHPLVPEGH